VGRVRLPLRRATVAAVVLLAACAAAPLLLETLPAAFTTGAVELYGPGELTVEGGEIISFNLVRPAEIALVAVVPDGSVSVLYPYAPGESSRFAAGPHALVVPVSLEWAPDPSARAPSVAAAAVAANDAYRSCVASNRSRSAGAAASRGDTASQRRADQRAPELADAQCRPPAPASASAAAGQPGTWRPRNDVVVLIVSDTPLTDEALRQRVRGLEVRSEAALRELPARILGETSSPWAGYYSVRLPPPRQQETPR